MRREAFEAAMDQYRPEEDGRIGEYLVRCGVVKPEALEATLQEQEQRVTPLVPA